MAVRDRGAALLKGDELSGRGHHAAVQANGRRSHVTVPGLPCHSLSSSYEIGPLCPRPIHPPGRTVTTLSATERTRNRDVIPLVRQLVRQCFALMACVFRSPGNDAPNDL